MASATKDVAQDNPLEMLYERGVTDGLPVVPPIRERTLVSPREPDQR
jgi:hypothetical protein